MNANILSPLAEFLKGWTSDRLEEMGREIWAALEDPNEPKNCDVFTKYCRLLKIACPLHGDAKKGKNAVCAVAKLCQAAQDRLSTENSKSKSHRSKASSSSGGGKRKKS